MTSSEPFFFFPYPTHFKSSLIVNDIDLSQSPALNTSISGITLAQAQARYLALYPEAATISGIVGDNAAFASITAGSLRAETATASSMLIDNGAIISGTLSAQRPVLGSLTASTIVGTSSTVGNLYVSGSSVFTGAETHAGNAYFSGNIAGNSASFTTLTSTGVVCNTISAQSAVHRKVTAAALYVTGDAVFGGGTTISGDLKLDGHASGRSATFQQMVTQSMTAPEARVGTLSSTAVISSTNASFAQLTAGELLVTGTLSANSLSCGLLSSAGIAASTGTFSALNVTGSVSAADAAFNSFTTSSLTTGGLTVVGNLSAQSMTIGDLVAQEITTSNLQVNSNISSTNWTCGSLNLSGTVNSVNASFGGLVSGAITAGGLVVSGGALQASSGMTVVGAFLANNANFSSVTSTNISSGNMTIANLYVPMVTAASILASTISTTGLLVSGAALVVNNGMTLSGGLRADKATFSGLYLSSGFTLPAFAAAARATLAGLLVTGNTLVSGNITTGGLLATGSVLISGTASCDSLFASSATIQNIRVTGSGLVSNGTTCSGLRVTGGALVVANNLSISGTMFCSSSAIFTNGVTFSSAIVSGDLLPESTDTYSFGSNSARMNLVASQYCSVENMRRPVATWAMINDWAPGASTWGTISCTYQTACSTGSGLSFLSHSISTGRWTNMSTSTQTMIISYQVTFSANATFYRAASVNCYNSSGTQIDSTGPVVSNAASSGNTILSSAGIVVIPAGGWFLLIAVSNGVSTSIVGGINNTNLSVTLL